MDTPEILLPLQHLTSSLEMIAHYYLMRGLKYKAIETLERACPLMELIPIEVESDQHRACFELLTSIYFNRFEENNVIEVMPKPSPLNPRQMLDMNKNHDKASLNSPSERSANTPVGSSSSKSSNQNPLKSSSLKNANDLKSSKEFKSGEDVKRDGDEEEDNWFHHHTEEVSVSDITSRLESIRIPFEHLRNEMIQSQTMDEYGEIDYDLTYNEMNIAEITHAFAMYNPSLEPTSTGSASNTYEDALSSESLQKLPNSMSYSDYDHLLIQMAEREHVHQEKIQNKKFISEQLKHRNIEDQNRIFGHQDNQNHQNRKKNLSKKSSNKLNDSSQSSSEFELLAIKFVKALLADGVGHPFPLDYFKSSRNDNDINMMDQDENVIPESTQLFQDVEMNLNEWQNRRRSSIESASIILRLAEETVEKLVQGNEGAERCRTRMVIYIY